MRSLLPPLAFLIVLVIARYALLNHPTPELAAFAVIIVFGGLWFLFSD